MMMNQPILRRSQAERKAATRKAVLAASVSELYEHGYGATTMAMIADKAGISRGAMLNHFPTKADLMAFVVGEVYQDEREEYERILGGTGSRRDRLLGYIDAAWQVIGRPSGVAVLEIYLGSRSDPVLAGTLKPIQDRIEADSYRILERDFGRSPTEASVTLVAWAVRGLSIKRMLFGEEGAEAAIALLRKYVEMALDTGLLPPLD